MRSSRLSRFHALLVGGLLLVPCGLQGQTVKVREIPTRQAPLPGLTLPELSASHTAGLLSRVQDAVDAAVLAETVDARNAALDAGEILARSLVDQEPESAEAHYWLAAVLGIRTENTGGLKKLSLGREVFRVSAKVLALDSLYAGGQELMGRVHANIQSLPWIARKMALSGDLSETVGESSWEIATGHFQRAIELDPETVPSRYELAKIYLDQDREAEARELLEWILEQEVTTPVEQKMMGEIRELLLDLGRD